jgi:hypothetical protein
MVAYYQESSTNYARIAKFAGIGIGATLLAVVAFIVAVFLWVILSTAGAASSADAFLESLGTDDSAQAYAMTSSRFQQEQDAARFASELEALGPVSFELLSMWRRTLPENGAVALKGALRTESGAIAPILIDMVDEDGWKVRTITDRMTGSIGPGAWFKGIPLESDVLQFVKATMADLGPAVMQNDFAGFIDQVPGTVLAAIVSSPLKRSFDQVVAGQINLSSIANIEPIFDTPPDWHLITACASFGGGCRTIGAGTLLMASGYYPVEPEPLHFKLIYAYKHPDWVLDCAFDRDCSVTIGSGEGR